MKKTSSMAKILNLLALNEYLKKRRLEREEKNLLYDNRLKASELNEKDRATIRRIIVS